MASHLMYMNLYTIFLLVMGLVAFFVAVVIVLRYKATVWLFGIVMFLVSIWSVAYGLQLSQRTLPAMFFFIQLEYIGISLLPAFWIIFILKYTGHDEWLKFRNLVLIFLIPVLTLCLVITNRWHNLYYESLSVIEVSKLFLLAIQPGPWYKIHVVYFYFTMLWGSYLLFKRMQKSDYNYRQQDIILFSSALLPWITNMLYLFGIRIHDHIDITPFAFILTCFLIIYGLFRYKLFSLIPIARDQIVQQMRDCVLILDTHNKIIDYNDKAEEILAENQLQGVSAESLFANSENLIYALNNSTIEKTEIELQHRTYEVNINFILTSTNRLKGKFLLFRDISQAKDDSDKMQEQAIRLHKLNILKDRLLSIISHDIRGPLRNLRELINMLNSEKINDDEFKKLMPEMGERLAETSMLLDNLLFWAKNQIQGLQHNQDAVNIHSIVAENFQLFKQQATNKKIKLTNKVSKGFTVSGDKNIIDIVLRNLISNAIKFSKPGGKVAITGEMVDLMSIITVSDTGMGMNANTQQKILNNENFSNPGTNQEMGAGIGLQLCKEFLEKLGGTISLRSEENKGTTFYLSLPSTLVKQN